MGQNTDFDRMPVPAGSAVAESGGASDLFFPDAAHQALTAKVAIPPNAGIVHVPVTPGEVVALPFGPDAHFEAAVGNGNLAIKVGDVVVILDGYAAASEQKPPVIETSGGHPLDIAAILAETDPATDIQTAAGAGSPAGGQGADNTGAILQPFGDAGGLGGFEGAGAQGDSRGPNGQPGVEVSSVNALRQSTEPGPSNTPPVAPDFTTDEDHGLTGQFAATDVDGNTLHYALVGAAPAGVSLAPDGKWVFDPAGSYDQLAPGDSTVVAFQVKATDGGGHSNTETVTIAVAGVNDAPQVVGGLPGIVTTEDTAATTFALGLRITDPDNATHTIALVGPVPDGFGYDAKTDQILVDPAGHYDFLKEGEKDYVPLHFQVSDGITTVGYDLDVEIIGSDDTPRLIGDLTGDVTEDIGVQATGQVFRDDPEDGRSTLPADSFIGEYGLLTLSADGKWTYTLDNNDPFINALNSNDTRTDAFPLDYPGITITIHGHNDAPTLSSILDPVYRSEDAPDHPFDIRSGSGISDPDSADFTYALVGNVPDGLTLDADGTAHFSPAGHFDYLAEGQTATSVISYKVMDSGGASSNTATFSVVVEGVNDLPQAVADSVITNAGSEGFVIPGAALVANDVDPDSPHLVAWTVSATTDLADLVLSNAGDLSVKDDAKLGGSFDYAAEDGVGIANPGHVTILNQNGGALTGSAGHEILIGSTADDKIDGKGGNDLIFGGDGDDTIVFHAGDVVQGGGDTSPHDLSVSRGDVLAIDHDLDFTKLDLTQSGGIETVSLQEAGAGGGAVQSLTIGASNVAQLSDHTTLTPNAVFGEHDAIHVDLEAVDQLYLSISKDGGAWIHYATGGAFEAYAHEATAGDTHTVDAYVLVQTPTPANVHMNQDAA